MTSPINLVNFCPTPQPQVEDSFDPTLVIYCEKQQIKEQVYSIERKAGNSPAAHEFKLALRRKEAQIQQRLEKMGTMKCTAAEIRQAAKQESQELQSIGDNFFKKSAETDKIISGFHSKIGQGQDNIRSTTIPPTNFTPPNKNKALDEKWMQNQIKKASTSDAPSLFGNLPKSNAVGAALGGSLGAMAGMEIEMLPVKRALLKHDKAMEKAGQARQVLERAENIMEKAQKMRPLPSNLIDLEIEIQARKRISEAAGQATSETMGKVFQTAVKSTAAKKIAAVGLGAAVGGPVGAVVGGAIGELVFSDPVQ